MVVRARQRPLGTDVQTTEVGMPGGTAYLERPAQVSLAVASASDTVTSSRAGPREDAGVDGASLSKWHGFFNAVAGGWPLGHRPMFEAVSGVEGRPLARPQPWVGCSSSTA